MKVQAHRAVMASRSEAPDSLDFFPTPPWATRALCEHVLGRPPGLDVRPDKRCWDPCAGQGHMAEVLREYFADVFASDVFPYRPDYVQGAFVAERLGLVDDLARAPWRPDWIIFNPPFNLAALFVLRALSEAKRGVAALVRAQWLEGIERYETIFSKSPPTTVAYFVERVPMTRGVWDPDADTATAYVWLVWDKKGDTTGPIWIPPGQRERLTKLDDARRFGGSRKAEFLPGIIT